MPEFSHHIPLWLKILYSLFLAVLIPIYWQAYGPAHFLWFSDIALLLTLVALWVESRLLAGMMAIAVLLPELAWNIGFLSGLLGWAPLFGTDYMFDPEKPALLKGFSLFHVFLPPLLLFLVYRLGYDIRSLKTQIVFSWIVLPATFLFTDPEKNINWVFGWGGSTSPAGWEYLLFSMVAIPLLIYYPTHLVLRKFFT